MLFQDKTAGTVQMEATLVDGVEHSKPRRMSYTREKKLEVLEFYKSSNKNLYRTAKKFSLNTKTLLR